MTSPLPGRPTPPDRPEVPNESPTAPFEPDGEPGPSPGLPPLRITDPMPGLPRPAVPVS